MSPIVRECRRRADRIEPVICLTGQHREMLRQVTEYFGIRADVCLDLMRPNQTLAGFAARCVEAIDDVIARLRPDCIVAQGDTTTVMAVSLAAFYRRIPFVHVEAGLRTGNLQAPWPEELNRRVADLVAALHCAPTERAARALLKENVSPEAVHVTGNTVIDALLTTLQRERANSDRWRAKYAMLDGHRMVLITGHRRESFGRGLENVCRAVRTLAGRFPDCRFVYPVHLNPNVQEPAERILGGVRNAHLIHPASYPEFVWLMDRSHVILTDSGGVQEEAPSLGKPLVVTRECTERPEAVECGAARLVGTSPERIIGECTKLLTDPAEYAACLIDRNPYGDGHAAERIVDLMLRLRGGSAARPASSFEARADGRVRVE